MAAGDQGSVAPSRRISYAMRKMVANSRRSNTPVAPTRVYICDGANMVLNLYSPWRLSKAVVNIRESLMTQTSVFDWHIRCMYTLFEFDSTQREIYDYTVTPTRPSVTYHMLVVRSLNHIGNDTNTRRAFVQLIPVVRDFLDLPPTHPGICVPLHQAHNLVSHFCCVGVMQP